MHGSATSFFHRIGRLLAAIEVTDAQGDPTDLDAGVSRAVERLISVGAAGGKIMLVGNGGSASIAGHMEMDLCNRATLRALVFNDPPVLTALANDYGYVRAFERLVTLWAAAGDCLIAISSSGQSENILRAVGAARHAGCSVITFTGFKPDNPVRASGDENFYVASNHYGEIEVAHHALGHHLTDVVVERAALAEPPRVGAVK